MADERWSKEFPKVEGVYWLRFNEAASSEDWIVELNMRGVRRIGAEGDIRNWTDISECEWLGPITPEQFEQFNSYDSLRVAAQAAEALIVKLYDKAAIPSLMQYEVDGVRDQIRAALNPKG